MATYTGLDGLTGTAFSIIAGGLTIAGGVTFADTITPLADGGAALGTGLLGWSDLFLDALAVINFDNGNVTITHSAGVLAIAGGGITMATIATAIALTDPTTAGLSITWTDNATEGIAMTLPDAKTVDVGMSMSGAGTYTDGILLDASNYGDAIHISGGINSYAINCVTGGVIIGGSGARLAQVYNGIKSLHVYTTSDSTDGGTSLEPQRFDNVLTGIGQVGGRFRINMSTDVRLGAWANAFKAQVECNDDGGSTGLLSVGCFELVVPTGNTVGAFSCLELEMTTPASGYTGAGSLDSYIFANCTGSTVSGFQDNGVFIHLDVGNAAGTGNLVGTGFSTVRCAFGQAFSHTLMYIPMSTAEESFTTAYPIVLGEDVELRFGDTAGGDIILSWTGQELLVEDTRTIDVGDGYNRTIHIASDITMTASRYAAVSCYAVLTAGSAGIEAFGGKFSLVQEATKTIDGFFGAVMAEVKNNADNCSTACALFCRWDNDSAVGFGGVMHSFIRFEDNSSQTKVNNLFELYNMDATTGASASEIVCAVGAANTPSHVIKISIGGVPYWIMMDSTPPA